LIVSRVAAAYGYRKESKFSVLILSSGVSRGLAKRGNQEIKAPPFWKAAAKVSVGLEPTLHVEILGNSWAVNWM
jgi:hypothetical protein